MTEPHVQESDRAAFPNLHWGWRHPIRRLSWRLAWWLLCRVTLRDYTTYQQARMIHDALGAYRPNLKRAYCRDGRGQRDGHVPARAGPTWEWSLWLLRAMDDLRGEVAELRYLLYELWGGEHAADLEDRIRQAIAPHAPAEEAR